MLTASCLAIQHIDIPGPPGSDSFGSLVTELVGGYHVVMDPTYDGPGSLFDIGAVHLYDSDWTLINTLTGSSPGDFVGSGGIISLADDGSFAVISSNWNNGTVRNVGAVTWCSTSSMPSTVSASNSVIGEVAGDRVGSGGIRVVSENACIILSPDWDHGATIDAGAATWISLASKPTGDLSLIPSLTAADSSSRVGSGGIRILSNDNYLVLSPEWHTVGLRDQGAVTWCPGSTGLSGNVSDQNSLVGGSLGDKVGGGRITELSNGNYVVESTFWDNGLTVDAGAVTWGDGSTGISGTVSATNSLVGSSANDRVGSHGVVPLPNGHYVVVSSRWNASPTKLFAGAVTWCNGTTGRSGSVSSANSLVGTLSGDDVGSGGVTVLECPGSVYNYVVSSPSWDTNTSLEDSGAVTWCAGSTGLTGPISATNSLVGYFDDSSVGSGGVLVLDGGNYVVVSPDWPFNSITPRVGAVTPVNGQTGLIGQVSVTNSITGTVENDHVGSGGVFKLANGHFVICSPQWDSGGIVDAGAVTWWSGANTTYAPVSTGNSLVGSAAADQVGALGAEALPSGDYVVRSPYFDHDTAADAGAVTWCNGTTYTSASVGPLNSLVGSSAGDSVGEIPLRVLTNSNYVVSSPFWDQGGIVDAGAATLCLSDGSTTGPVTDVNSLVGSQQGDQVSSSGTVLLSDGNFLVCSRNWDRDAVIDAGAITWVDGDAGLTGAVSPTNSLVGGSANDLIGSTGVHPLPDGLYLTVSTQFDHNTNPDSGAVSMNFPSQAPGGITPANSLLGTRAMGQPSFHSYDSPTQTAVIGRPESKLITLLKPESAVVGDGDSRNFGTSQVGQSSILTFWVDESDPEVVPAISGDANSSFAILSTTDPDSNGRIMITVHFNPQSTGSLVGTLNVGDQSINLTGSGNSPPSFAGHSATTYHETSLYLYYSKMLRNVTDPDGDAYFVTAASTTTPGASVQILPYYLIYTPPEDHEGVDSFVLTLTDARGASSTSTVTVAVGGPFGNNRSNGAITPAGSGTRPRAIRVTFKGIPGRPYLLQESQDLMSWSTVTTEDFDDGRDPKLLIVDYVITGEANGTVSFYIKEPPEGSNNYRLLSN